MRKTSRERPENVRKRGGDPRGERAVDLRGNGVLPVRSSVAGVDDGAGATPGARRPRSRPDRVGGRRGRGRPPRPGPGTGGLARGCAPV
ncbi:hypothetical protein STXM2123_2455 [Streptomyces sp. F-3]|nr:hypothetical protein STXM2123_2455 [Streptomyces sp. F-3]